jgi:hypothetical protein
MTPYTAEQLRTAYEADLERDMRRSERGGRFWYAEACRAELEALRAAKCVRIGPFGVPYIVK